MPEAAPSPRDAAPRAVGLLALLLACAPRPAIHTEPAPPPEAAARPVQATPTPLRPPRDPRPADASGGPDADADGVPDADDRCPDEPEPADGVDDHDGCPEPPRHPVIICQRPIRSVTFGTGSPGLLDPAAGPVLDEVAAVLRDRPDLRLRLTGHADPHEGRGEADRRARARARAQRVQAELVHRGADPSRLDVASDGSTHPVDGRDTPEAHARNRRVDFQLVEPDPAATPPAT